MSDKTRFKKFINNGDFSEDKINKLKNKISITDKRLIRNTFNLLNEEISYLNETQDFIHIIINCVELLNILCNEKEFSPKEILINRKRIKGSREALLAYSNKLKNEDLLYAANKLDEIILDKGIELEDLIRLIKRLVDRKEEFGIIKKLYNTNRGVITYKNNELFDYVFYKALDSLKNNTADIYYYISLLKIFYSSKIDKTKYLIDLNKVSDETNDFANEIYNIIYGKKRILTPEEILNKYGVITDFKTVNIEPINNPLYDDDDFIIAIDTNGTQVRDDALSIKQDGDNFVVGIHIADPTSYLDKEGIINYQARNNFSCTYFRETSLKILPANFEKSLSLDKNTYKKVLSMYVIINKDGTIKDYKITPNIIKINENLYYDECDLLLNYYCNETSNKIKQLYEVSSILEQLNKEKYTYWSKKENDSLENNLHEHETDKIVSELMVLYNHLCAKEACNTLTPYVYRTQNSSYINNLVRKLNINISEETQKIINGIYLRSKYSYLPIYHSGLHLDVYSHSTSPLRRYPDLYNQILMHGLYFKDMPYEFNEEYHKAIIEYFNQRNIELSLMASEYSRALKLKKD